MGVALVHDDDGQADPCSVAFAGAQSLQSMVLASLSRLNLAPVLTSRRRSARCLE